MDIDAHKIWIIFRALALVAVGIYIVIAVLLTLYQSSFVYYPTRDINYNPSDVGLKYDDVFLNTKDNIKLHAWYIPYDSARATILLCHGNGGNISHRVDLIKLLHDLKFNVFIFDYRGYGQSTGNLGEKGTYTDAETAWLYLVDERGVTPNNIIIHGRSLGGAIAAYLARNHTPGALIVESSFTTAKDVAKRMFPYFPINIMIRYDYNTNEYISQCKCPILVIHSKDDEMIHYDFGQKLFETANEPKTFLEISGSHGDGYFTSGDEYTTGLGNFIETYIKAK